MDTSKIKTRLIEHFKAQGLSTHEGQWKRMSKKKDDQGRVVREFSGEGIGVVQVTEVDGDLAISAPGHTTAGGGVFTLPEFTEEARLRCLAIIR